MLEIVFVGTGDAFGSGGRRNTAILLRSRTSSSVRSLLLDCGPSTMVGLKALGIDPLDIDAIALSHYHGDHTAGVPFLLLDYLWESRRTRPLHIFGPKGVEDRVLAMSRVFEYHSHTERCHPLEFREFPDAAPLRIDGFEILTMPAHHQPNTHPHMLRVSASGRSIVFSGDTGWHEELPDKVGDADLFISECVFMEEAFEWHLAHDRLDRERHRFRCGSTILTHLGSQVLANIDRVHFDTAHDGLRLEL